MRVGAWADMTFANNGLFEEHVNCLCICSSGLIAIAGGNVLFMGRGEKEVVGVQICYLKCDKSHRFESCLRLLSLFKQLLTTF